MPNITVPLIHVPAALSPAADQARTYKTLFALGLKAVADGAVDPAAGSPSTGIPGLTDWIDGKANIERRSALFFPGISEAKLSAFADQHQVSVQDAFSWLCRVGLGVLQDNEASRTTRVERVDDLPPFLGARPLQTLFYRQATATLSANRISLSEASTGSGKGRALAAAAIHQARAGKTPVVIAAPTLIVLGQIWCEMETLRAQGLGLGLRMAFFPGATEFADQEKLLQYLAEEPNPDPGVREWVEAGGPIRRQPADAPLIRALLQQCDGGADDLRFMMDDLRAIATTVDPNEFVIKSGAGNARVRDVRDAARRADVILCTHAMLALSQMTQWAVVPEPEVLVIDEAHEFERIVANIHSRSVSLRALLRTLSRLPDADTPRSAVRKSVKATQALLDLLGIMERDRESIYECTHINESLPDNVIEAIRTLAAALKTKVMAKLLSTSAVASRTVGEANDTLAQVLKAAAQAATGQGVRDRAAIEYSPVRGFPSISVGPSSIGGVLGGLWKTIKGGALLISATLFIPDEYGNAKPDYLVDTLALPRSRVDAHPPIVEPWVTGIPVMHTPGTALATRLSRPAARVRDEKSEREWHAALAAQIDRIADQARGGTLVLLTSFDQIVNVGEKMKDKSARTVFMQSNREKFDVTQDLFKHAVYAGQRPVLLACGRAWTGLNLLDERMIETPQNDFLLTDLVIGCCPVGLNRSTVMKARTERYGTLPVAKEALMLLRQGLGRLVRSPHVTDRHIWILDGRLFLDWAGMQAFAKPARFLLNSYKKRATFDD